RTDAVDADGVQHGLLVLRHHGLDVQATADGVVGRGLPHAAGLVGPCPDTGDVAAGRDDHLGVAVRADRVLDLDPRVVERGVCAVVHRDVAAPLLDLLHRHAGRGVQDRHAVAVLLAVADQRGLHGLPQPEV